VAVGLLFEEQLLKITLKDYRLLKVGLLKSKMHGNEAD